MSARRDRSQGARRDAAVRCLLAAAALLWVGAGCAADDGSPAEDSGTGAQTGTDGASDTASPSDDASPGGTNPGGTSPDGTSGGDVGTTAPDSASTGGPTPGDDTGSVGDDCRWTPHMVGESQHSLPPSEYFLYVPGSYDPTVPMPLVIALHGTGGNGEAWLDQCGVRATADARGFIVASPSAWDDALQFGYDEHGEIAFMEGMIEEIEDCYTIDEKREYMFGFSQGGFFSIFYCLIGHEDSMTACGAYGAHAPWEGFNLQYNDEGRQLPFYLVTGAEDSQYVMRAIDFQVGLEGAGYPHFFDTPAGLGHACPAGGLAPMYEWWEQQGPLP